uniref:Protein disulfide-isomerase n=2 Tax=Anthurium amnicola TaxID=1678845 RepID=A0A1D1Z615_9ARAE
MPPERQSFGVISERSLLPSFGLGDPGAWCLLIHFSGVPNLSKIIEDVEDLRTALQMHHSAILEVKRDQRNQEGAFPVNRPSIILFVDRSSESPRIREDSKSALEVYKQVAHHYQLSNQMCGGQGDDHSKISPMQAFQEMQNKGYLSPYSHLTTASSSSPRIGKVKDQLAFMIMNQGESLPSDKVSSDNQDNHAYDILQHLLRQQNSAVKTKGTKISLLAKEIGFQLLSDDFDVKVIDVQPPLQEGDRLRSTSESFITRTDAQNLEQLLESSDNVHIDDSVDTTNIAAEDGKQSELSAVRPVLEWNEEPIPSRQIITKVPSTESSQESLEDDIWLSKSTGASEAVSHCKPLELSSLMAHAEINSHSQHNLRGDEPFGKDNGDLENCNANDTCYSEVAHTSTQCSPNEASMGADIMKEQCSTGAGNGQQIYHHAFTGSFFFSDGGYRLLRGLTEGSRIPSVVILDPVQQQHYALPKETEFAFDSLVNFIDKFLNGSLSSYQRSEPSIQSPREMPQPPFVNLDFHEADGIPRVTANTFSELVLSSANCDKGGRTYCAQKVDVLVFFSTSWCGFCQRMELVVREVYLSLKSFKSLLRSDLTDKAFVPFQDKPEDASLNDLPSIYHMDCTLNDCSPFLKLYGKGEVYPALVLFPAERENAFTYEGDVSVLDIFEFLANHGSNSHILNEYKGIVWNQAQKGHGNGELLNDAFPILVQDQIPVSEEDDFRDYPSDTQVIIGNDQQPVNVHITEGSPKEGEQVAVGSILTATDKLLNVFPFDKSSVLIVKVDQNEGFQGLILNKHINWDIFEKLDKELAALKQAPLSFGGPVRMRDLPLFSLAQRPINAYSKVASNIYFGDPLATRETIERIKSENASASDFWFFLGCSSWGWNQLFDELAEGAWQLGVLNVGNLEWPEI